MDPESILREGRGARSSAEAPAPPQSPVPSDPDRPVRSVEPWSEMNQARIDYGVPYETPFEESSLSQDDMDPEEYDRRRGWVTPESESSDMLENIDPQEAFYRNLGYLPPWDEETTAVMNAIIANPSTATQYARRNATGEDFFMGLDRRNVDTNETKDPDVYEDINHLPEYSLQETDAERESYERLWALDHAKCRQGWSHAFFRRTFVMGLIARHSLIYGESATEPSCLDFNVEEPWTCPPMPTGDSFLFNKFLTQPKPDLAVCFRRKKVIRDNVFYHMPDATQRLACYENMDHDGRDKAFHFFTIETTSWRHPDTPLNAKYRCLNNASQALHNMFQFFQDAGPQHREIFFSHVRFFSVVASTQGLEVRVHRAIELPGNLNQLRFGFPIRFVFRELASIPRERLDRGTVLELIGRIIHGYGVGKLLGLLQDAAKSLWDKLDREHPEGHWLRMNPDFYRYPEGGNTAASSKKQTPTTPRRLSVESHTSVNAERSEMLPGSANMAESRPDQPSDTVRSRPATPTQSHPSPSTQVLGTSGKRARSQHDDDNAPQRSKRQRQ